MASQSVGAIEANVLFAVDASGVFTLSEGPGLGASGLGPGELVGRSAFDAYRGEPELLGNLRRALSGEAFVSDVEVAGRTFRCSYNPLRGGGGAVIGAMGTATDLAGRGRAEDALVESEERYRMLVENAQEGIALVGSSHEAVVEYCNAAYAGVFGLVPEELVGCSFFDFLEGEEREEALRQREIRLGGAGSSYELTVTAADGKKHLSCGGYPIFGPDGSYRGSVQTIVDVTENKRSAEALRVRDRAMASSSDGVVITDPTLPDGPIVYANPAFERITGYSAPEAVGRNCRFLQGEDRDQPALRELGEALRAGRECRVVLRNYKKDGTPFWNELSVSPVCDGEGRVVNFVGVQTDVTERKRMEQTLLESEERFRLTFERAAVGMAHVTPDGSWVRINDALCGIVGYSREELLQMTFQSITDEADLDADLRHVERILAGEIKEYSMEKRYVRKDYSRVWVELSVSLIRKLSGEPDYFVCIIENIHERKLREFVPDLLTPREEEVLRLIARWKTNGEIARSLNYSLGTVKLHVQRVLAKLGVESRSQAVARAVEIGFLKPPH